MPKTSSEIVAGKRSVTADTDLRLCRFFGLSDGWWLRLQADHDTELAKVSLSKTLAKIRPWKDSLAPTDTSLSVTGEPWIQPRPASRHVRPGTKPPMSTKVVTARCLPHLPDVSAETFRRRS